MHELESYFENDSDPELALKNFALGRIRFGNGDFEAAATYFLAALSNPAVPEGIPYEEVRRRITAIDDRRKS